MNQNKVVVITIVIILAIGLLWITKPWQKIGGEVEESTSGGGGGENQQPTENQQEGGGITVPPGYTLFKYQASFQYLSSEDNAPIANDLFMVFPCPTVDNQVVVDTDEPVQQTPTRILYPIENIVWQLWAYYENNNDLVKHLQIENNITIGAEFVEPRENAPFIHKPWVQDTSHGPKIWYQLDYGDWNFEENQVTQGAAAFYQNEVARIETRFLVTENNENKVTLVDNQGGIYFGANGYSGDSYKPIRYSVEVSLSKWSGNTFESLGTFSAIADNPPRYTWIELSQE